MSEWQPIETAPKDGTVIFGYIGVPWLFVWVNRPESETTTTGVWPFRKTITKERVFRGWHGVIPYEDGYALLWPRHAKTNQPTHWMPLPEPPK